MRAAHQGETQQRLVEHRRIWQRKPVLRRIYQEEFFARLLSFQRREGFTVEVGAGPGFLKEMCPRLVATDTVWCPWLDAVADAGCLPFLSGRVANLVGVDILHHLERPIVFLREAERVLAVGGRLILVEPWITPFSYLIYRYLHQEGCDLKALPWEGSATAGKKPLDGNLAVPYLMFYSQGLAKTLSLIPGFRLIRLEAFCLFAYLFSLGFWRMSLLPNRLYPFVSRWEHRTHPVWKNLAALRACIVLEKQGAAPAPEPAPQPVGR